VSNPRGPFDLDAYKRATLGGPCFICAFLHGDPGYRHEAVYEDPECVAFLSRYPTLRGYTLVAPRRHVVDVTGDFALFRHITDVVHEVAEALRNAVPTERIYLLSLGSHQGNAHVHWHVAPLPPGVPYPEQQYHALMAENGVLEFSAEEQVALAAEVRVELVRQHRSRSEG